MLKFSIRGLLTFVMVVALVCGWWSDRQRLTSEVMDLQDKMAIFEMAYAGLELNYELATGLKYDPPSHDAIVNDGRVVRYKVMKIYP